MKTNSLVEISNIISQYQRSVALQLLKKGFSSKEIAKILNVRTQAVAAWKAHRTMGRY